MNNFSIPNSSDNHALMATVGSRIRADAKMLAATAAFWRLLGCGGLLLLGGIGMGMAAFGYSYVADQRATMAKLTTALADALNKVTLKADGTVKVSPETTVKLAPNSIVKLDTNGASVRLDADSTSRPTPRQLDPNAQPQSKASVVTDYSVFKTVRFEQGWVMTGWDYNSSDDSAPYSQVCYYTVNTSENTGNRYNIAKNGVLNSYVLGLPVDIGQAFNNCVWHSSTTAKPGRRT